MENEYITVEEYNQYLRLLVRLVPDVLYKGNKKAEQALIRLCMECFEHGIEFEKNGKLKVVV